MAVLSKRILLYGAEKFSKINSDTLKLYQKYKIDMTIRELSQGTIGGYENDLYSFFIYVSENQSNRCITELTEDDIIEFIYFCKVNGNNSRRIKRRLSSLSAFYKFIRRKRLIAENPMEFVERPRRDTDVNVQTFLTDIQVKSMKQKLKDKGNMQLELYAMLSLSTMARVNAISNISWKQIDFETRTISDVLEKDNKTATLYFNNDVKELLVSLKNHRKENEIDDYGWIFITYYNKKTSKVKKATLQDWSKRIGVMIGISTFHAHDFRHTGAQLLKLKGCPIETISELLNHASIDVTRKYYLRQDKEKMMKEKDKYEL